MYQAWMSVRATLERECPGSAELLAALISLGAGIFDAFPWQLLRHAPPFVTMMRGFWSPSMWFLSFLFICVAMATLIGRVIGNRCLRCRAASCGFGVWMMGWTALLIAIINGMVPTFGVCLCPIMVSTYLWLSWRVCLGRNC